MSVTKMSSPQQSSPSEAAKAAPFSPPAASANATAFDVKDLSIWYGEKQAINDVTIAIPAKSITAIIGPSGCGKSTFLRCLNRMHELVPRTRMDGQILFYGEDLYASGIDPAMVRRRVGMVFQKSNPFPTMSIEENVLVGLRLNGVRDRQVLRERLEKSLRMAALWDEVKSDLKKPGMSISGGQQQRLCIARALAVEPEVLLMDEPCSALDPIATAKIEELIRELRDKYTIVIVTHNMQQAGRVSDKTAFFYVGELIEYGDTTQLFNRPLERRPRITSPVDLAKTHAPFATHPARIRSGARRAPSRRPHDGQPHGSQPAKRDGLSARSRYAIVRDDHFRRGRN
jgi:phosphate transport system ATP-binding protein